MHPGAHPDAAMKRSLCCLILALAASAAQAQWDMLGRNADLRLFIDRTPLQREGDLVTVRQMIDYTSAQWSGASVVLSVLHLVEYDCRARRARTLAMGAFSEQMGAGRQVMAERFEAPEWMDIPAGGSGEGLWKAACHGE